MSAENIHESLLTCRSSSPHQQDRHPRGTMFDLSAKMRPHQHVVVHARFSGENPHQGSDLGRPSRSSPPQSVGVSGEFGVEFLGVSDR